MGAVSPVDFVDEEFMKKVKKNIVERTINGISSEKINYKGIKYFRLDAIAFIWKKSGGSCVHLNETHELVKVIRLILENLKSEL